VNVGRELDETTREGWLNWLAARSGEDRGVTGFDVVGWPAATWVLHSIYEDPTDPGVATHDDVRRAQLASGFESPLVVGSFNLDDVSTVIGSSLGMSERPEPHWTRLRWQDLAARLGVDFASQAYPPGLRSFP
jgi:hypothetical protein